MKTRIPRRVLAVFLSLVMVLTLLPVASAAADDTATTTNGIVLSKTATLEDDGTYTINLEAYATGTTTTTTTTSSVPLDIVLVIDQSGSMAYNDSGSSTNTESDRRYYKLKAAVTSFVETISANAKSTGADHRIAIAGYGKNGTTTTTSITGAYISSGSNQRYWVNTGLFINGTLKNYGSNSQNSSEQLTATDYQNALVSAYDEDTDSVTASITTAISNFAAYGGTYTEYGLMMAQKVFANNSATYTYTDENGTMQTGTRKRIVILFTDGETDSEVSTVLSYSNTLKSTYSATVYCVGFGSSVNSDFLSYVSSNYGSDTSYSSSFWGSGYSGTSSGTTKYSMTASNATELNNIFQTITEDVSSDSTTVTLDADSVMKDIIGDGFTLTDDYKVTIKTVAGTADTEGNITWGAETENNAKADISEDKTTVSVTGFDYADKYISSGHAGEKICVTITGVLPTDDAATGEVVYTNDAASGIYATADATEATATFEQPETIITKKAYVLDYAKTASLTGLDQDTSIIGIVSSFQSVPGSDLSLIYGTLAQSGTSLSYTPTTTQWKGYDSFYVFGKTTNSTVTALEANKNGNLWSKVSVIPANNVYYEDDFVTSESDGIVGIEYTGDWDEISDSTEGTENTETANGSTHGWEESLANDATYSDGSAHGSGTCGATATFTFTGTGVDIYSRTNMYSGMVIVKLTSTTTSKSQGLIIDGLAESGDYYQIPTASFNNLDYDTYTVTITVMSDGTNGSYTYYLDGIRIYNPLGTVTEDDGDSYEAYKADNELNAVFTEVRDILINNVKGFSADGSVTGAVFIDEINDTTKITTGSLSDYVTYGPENEVYLAKDQAIVFKVDTDSSNTYYLGLKAPSGSGTTGTTGTTAEVTNGADEKATIDVNAASDLYYEITPDSNGFIMVKNTGDNLLSITKLRTTNATTANSGIATTSLNELVSYANSFSLLSTVSYIEDAVTEEELEDGTYVDTETGDVVEELDEDDIEIDNPTEDSEEQQEEETGSNSQQSIFSNLFSAIRQWFNRRR